MRFADPTNDVAFKKIFGDENKKEILISFLNAVLDFTGNDTIKSITIVNPYQVPKIEDLKNTILDIKAVDNNNNSFIVEMQVAKDKEFAKRSLYYTSKSYVSQLGISKEYSTLQKVYFIGILNFAILETQEYISRHLILDAKTLKQEIGDFEFTFIELPKFTKSLASLENSITDKWIYFIKNASNFELIPAELENIKEFKEAFEIAQQYTWSKQEMEVYDYVSMREGIQENALKTALEDGLKLGMEKGLAKGMEKGMEKGREEGQFQAKLSIAKNLLDLLDDETLSLKTGLSISEIANLRG